MEVITQHMEEEISLVRRLRESSSGDGEETNNESKPSIPMIQEENENINEGAGGVQENYIQAADLSAALQNADIQNAIHAVANYPNVKNLHQQILSGGFSITDDEEISVESQAKEKSVHIKFDIEGEGEAHEEEEEEEEEIVELEFEKEVLHTHNVYCPNCSSKVTKVILRRKVKKRVPTPTTTEDGLFGCLSCFGVFAPIGNILKPFPIWNGTTEVNNASEKGQGFNCFGIFANGGESPNQPPPENSDEQTPAPAQNNPPLLSNNNELTPAPSPDTQTPPKHNDEPTPAQSRNNQPPLRNNTPPKPNNQPTQAPSGSRDIVIPIVPEPTHYFGTKGPVIRSENPDIIKSLIYGGLTESITSLSVVSSAAASHASTLNIVGLGFANLIGGLFVLGQCLLDLKNDQQVDRYTEILGRKKHFFLHATLAILSYLVFGLVPPVVYGFTFRETDDRDFKLLAAGVASFICIFVLAIGKAYIQGPPHKFTTYLKTVLYYISTAVLASGVGFAVGELVNNYMEQFGWFEPNQAANLLFNGNKSLHPSFASY